ncbi:MAG TPA: DoxX family protein [Candidatus Baltobacteraceae bacterium]|nr:DoxX family protein [Candidatus Baltobacteraceae bacterium]
MESTLAATAPAPSLTVLWTARVLYVLATAFMLFDAAAKYFIAPGIADAFHRQGMPLALAPVIATILLILVALYVVPRTAVFGAVLLTGYFGGACACNLRAGFTPFETLFPVVFGIVVWAPIYLLNPRVRALIPLQRQHGRM